MTEAEKLALLLVAVLLVGLTLICAGLGWLNRISAVALGIALAMAATSLLAALIRGGGR